MPGSSGVTLASAALRFSACKRSPAGAGPRCSRRPVEAATQTLPLVALLALPAVAGMSHIFPWAQPNFFSIHALPHHQHYLTEGWFWFRAVLYFRLVIPLAFLVRTYIRAAELRPAGSNTRAAPRPRRHWCSGLCLTHELCVHRLGHVAGAANGSSTIFAIIFMASQFLVALALSRRSSPCSLPLRATLTPALLARCRQPAPRLRHLLGLCHLLAVPHHLVGQSAARDFVVCPSAASRLAAGGALLGDRAVPVTLCAASFARGQASAAPARGHCRLHLRREPAEYLLAHRSDFHPPARRLHWLDFAALLAIGGVMDGHLLAQAGGRLCLSALNKRMPRAVGVARVGAFLALGVAGVFVASYLLFHLLGGGSRDPHVSGPQPPTPEWGEPVPANYRWIDREAEHHVHPDRARDRSHRPNAVCPPGPSHELSLCHLPLAGRPDAARPAIGHGRVRAKARDCSAVGSNVYATKTAERSASAASSAPGPSCSSSPTTLVPNLCQVVLERDPSKACAICPGTAGKDFDVIVVSIDPADTPAHAS